LEGVIVFIIETEIEQFTKEKRIGFFFQEFYYGVKPSKGIAISLPA
jgi:hypothetical protein